MSWPCENPHCPYDLWAPDRHDKVTNVAFSAYAFHQQKIEDFINALAACPDPNDYEVQRSLARQILGCSLDRLTDAEIKYIEKEVAKRW